MLKTVTFIQEQLLNTNTTPSKIEHNDSFSNKKDPIILEA